MCEQGALSRLLAEQTPERAKDMYLASEMLARIATSGEPKFEDAERAHLKAYRAEIDGATEFIPAWAGP